MYKPNVNGIDTATIWQINAAATTTQPYPPSGSFGGSVNKSVDELAFTNSISLFSFLFDERSINSICDEYAEFESKFGKFCIELFCVGICLNVAVSVPLTASFDVEIKL